MNMIWRYWISTGCSFRGCVGWLAVMFWLSGFCLTPLAAAVEDAALRPARVETDCREHSREFQGIPGVAITQGGRLWAVWYGGGEGPGPGNYVMASHSDDKGETWSGLDVCIRNEVRVFDPAVWVDPAGTLWLFYSQGHTLWDGRAGVWAIVCANPDGETPVWSAPRRLADGIMLNKPTALSTGEWLFPIARWNQKPNDGVAPESRLHVPEEAVHWAPEEVGTHTYLSDDGGATLRRLSTVRIREVYYDEHMFVERGDGALRLFVRSEEEGIVSRLSTDRGLTWQDAGIAPIPHVPARFFVRRLRSGNLLLVKHNPELDGVWLHGGGVAETRTFRARLVAYLSDDDGKTWRGGLVLDERVAVSYPDGDQHPDGTVFVVYDRDRTKAREILMATFTEADVLAGRIVSPGGRLKRLVNQPPKF